MSVIGAQDDQKNGVQIIVETNQDTIFIPEQIEEPEYKQINIDNANMYYGNPTF